MTLENPVLWNAEEPYLYKVVLEAAGEVITDRMGIREICTRDGVVYINGVKVKFHAPTATTAILLQGLPSAWNR